MNLPGQEIKGELHSTDASAGVEVPLFELGSLTQRTLDEDEYIEIHSAELFSAATGDVHLFTGADASPGAGETAVRGTVGANGSVEGEHIKHRGLAGHKAFFIAPLGVSDCMFYGSIRREKHSSRPEFREDLLGR